MHSFLRQRGPRCGRRLRSPGGSFEYELFGRATALLYDAWLYLRCLLRKLAMLRGGTPSMCKREKTMFLVRFCRTQKNHLLLWAAFFCFVFSSSSAYAQCSAGAACTSTPTISTAACGNTVLPVMGHGSSTAIGCPGGCTGTLSLSCANGVYTISAETCALPVGACGAANCYNCSGGVCVLTPTGPYTDPSCLSACGGFVY